MMDELARIEALEEAAKRVRAHALGVELWETLLDLHVWWCHSTKREGSLVSKAVWERVAEVLKKVEGPSNE